MKTVFQNVQNIFWKESVPLTSTSNCTVWDGHLVRDGRYAYFDDIDYAQQNVAVWDALNHINRIGYKLRTVGREAALADTSLQADIRAALYYWLDNDFKNPNWWYNQIGLVNALSAVIIMLYEVLPQDIIDRSAAIIGRGSLAGCPAIDRWTGANLIWGIRDTIYHALIIGDSDLLQTAARRIEAEICVAGGNGEGIKPDMSFWQHGAILYSCGYGRSFTRETAQLIAILSGSAYALDSEKIRLFETFVLEGQRYMTRGRYVDYQTIGREIARPGAVSAGAVADAVSLLKDTAECTWRDELAAYAHALTTGEDHFTGTKYFPHSYFLSHNTEAFHIGVKGFHTGYKGTEWGLSENRLGYNLNYGGVTTCMASGGEYGNLNPLTDYSAIPGTTAPHWDEAKLWEKSVGDWKSETGHNDDCGGWADGTYGVLYMRPEHDGISGYKAYFAFPGGMVCLGCALAGPEPLYTTVEQAFAAGEPFAKRTVGPGEAVSNGTVRYVNLSDVPMYAEAKTVCGTWRKNSPAESEAPVTGTVFLAQIDHRTADSYAYAILSDKTDPCQIAEIVNTAQEQSVTFADGTCLAVLRQDGETRIRHS